MHHTHELRLVFLVVHIDLNIRKVHIILLQISEGKSYVFCEVGTRNIVQLFEQIFLVKHHTTPLLGRIIIPRIQGGDIPREITFEEGARLIETYDFNDLFHECICIH